MNHRAIRQHNHDDNLLAQFLACDGKSSRNQSNQRTIGEFYTSDDRQSVYRYPLFWRFSGAAEFRHANQCMQLE